jgi:DNA-binding MarR family transcriptional regulator
MSSTEQPSQSADTFVPDFSVTRKDLLLDGNDERLRRVLFLIRFSADRLTSFRETIARSIDLSDNQYVILLAIAHAQGQGGITVKGISGYSLMAATHITTQVGFLVKKGLVRKKPNSKDGRSVLLTLTKKGEHAITQITPSRQKFNDAFFENITPTMLIAVEKFLMKAADNAERALSLLKER